MDTIEQGTEAWLQLRLGKITASRITDVIAQVKSGEAAGRENYRIELVCERLTGKPTEGFTNAHMERGTELEPFARAWYEVEKGEFVKQVPFVDHPTIKNAGASPDGIIGEGLIEIKCPMAKTHIKYLLEDRVPAKYMPQMAWQMACTQRKWCDFVSFDPRMPEGLQLFIQRVDFDAEYVKMLEAEITGFLAELETKIEKLNERKHGQIA
jgi:putative phage-type endonuclease